MRQRISDKMLEQAVQGTLYVNDTGAVRLGLDLQDARAENKRLREALERLVGTMVYPLDTAGNVNQLRTAEGDVIAAVISAQELLREGDA